MHVNLNHDYEIICLFSTHNKVKSLLISQVNQKIRGI